jgi:hypothetical protein
VLAITTVILVIVKACRGTLKETWKVFFFIFVILGSCLRGLWALFDPLMLANTLQLSNRTDLFLNIFPSVLFFSCYLILLFIWVELYHYPVRGRMRIHHLRVHLWVVLGVMFAIFLVLFLVDLIVFPSKLVSISSPSNVVERILILFVAAIYVITCVAFTVYGFLVLVPLWRTKGGADSAGKRRDMLLRLLALTMLIMIIFLVRAAMVFIGYFSNWSFISFFDLLYYVTCEILPIFMMFFILLYRGGNNPNTSIQYHRESFSADEKAQLMSR